MIHSYKIKKQESIIRKYKYQKIDPEEFDAQLKEKDDEINHLRKEVENFTSKTEEKSGKNNNGEISASEGFKA